jgi:hypothetical protein
VYYYLCSGFPCYFFLLKFTTNNHTILPEYFYLNKKYLKKTLLLQTKKRHIKPQTSITISFMLFAPPNKIFSAPSSNACLLGISRASFTLFIKSNFDASSVA